jgi:hypothetical protein
MLDRPAFAENNEARCDQGNENDAVIDRVQRSAWSAPSRHGAHTEQDTTDRNRVRNERGTRAPPWALIPQRGSSEAAPHSPSTTVATRIRGS